jgi:DNA-binding NarL/FixJ family response regulator
MSNLTKRQSITAKLVGSGLSNKQIARELDISEGTVKAYHLRQAGHCEPLHLD